MNNFEKFLTDKLLEGAGKGEQRGRAHLKDIPGERSTRHQGFGLGMGPHGGHDPGEGSEADIKKQENMARLEAALKKPTITGIQRAQIKAYYDRLKGSREMGSKTDRSRTMQQSEGKQKQARIKSDIEKTRVGATGSNEPSDPRYSRAMTSLHNSPEDIKRRKELVKVARIKRRNQIAFDKLSHKHRMQGAWDPSRTAHLGGINPRKEPDWPQKRK